MDTTIAPAVKDNKVGDSSPPALVVISLGWGVQSWTLAAMSALGHLPPVDYAIHADTLWESSGTYQFADRWSSWLNERGVKVLSTKSENGSAVVEQTSDGRPTVHIPAYAVEGGRKPGQISRVCTRQWKISPIKQVLSRELFIRGLTKKRGIVEQWLGITTDEFHRAKDSNVQYISHRFPLIEMNMSRADCVKWLEWHGLQVPPKSACVFCPYHNRAGWEEKKRKGGKDWETAVEIDLMIRDTKPGAKMYIHGSGKPLSEAVSISEDYGYSQLSMIDDDDAECGSGYCFA